MFVDVLVTFFYSLFYIVQELMKRIDVSILRTNIEQVIVLLTSLMTSLFKLLKL